MWRFQCARQQKHSDEQLSVSRLRWVDTLDAIDLGLLDTDVQGLVRTADLRSDRHHRLPARAMLAVVDKDQPHSTLANFRGKPVRCLARDAPPYSGVGEADSKRGGAEDGQSRALEDHVTLNKILPRRYFLSFSLS